MSRLPTLPTRGAGIIVLWRFAGARAESGDAEHRAHRLIALTFWVIPELA